MEFIAIMIMGVYSFILVDKIIFSERKGYEVKNNLRQPVKQMHRPPAPPSMKKKL